jgi:chromosome segregation ATPase
MATSDKFIESMVELLDKLIENQSKNASILTEMKSSISELRNETSSILTNIRDRLPEIISREQEENYHKLMQIASKIEDSNVRLTENIRIFESDYHAVKNLIERNEQSIRDNQQLLKEILSIVYEKKEQTERAEGVLKDVKGFIDGLKSKKAWVALIVAGIAAVATAVSAVVGGINSIEDFLKSKNTTNQPIKTPANPAPQPPSNPTP